MFRKDKIFDALNLTGFKNLLGFLLLRNEVILTLLKIILILFKYIVTIYIFELLI